MGAGGPVCSVRCRDSALHLRLPRGAGEGAGPRAPGPLRPGALGEVLRRPCLQMGSRIWSFGFHFWKGWCIKPAKQCLWTYILYTTAITWHDSKRRGGFDPHDVLHHVGRGVPVPGLHSVLCVEGVLHHLRRHVRAELPSSHYQLQTTSLLERGLEAAAAAQAGLTPDRLCPDSLKPLFHSVYFAAGFYYYYYSQQTLSLRISN